MTKLNEILSIEKTTKTAHHQALTEMYHTLQKPTLFQGISQKYTPRDPNDTDLVPDKQQNVQLTAKQILADAKASLQKFMEVSATRDYTNTIAKADVVLDGQVLIKDAPVPFLLFLEKQLQDLKNFVLKIPTLDPAETWEFDETTGQFRTREIKQFRNKKVPRNHVISAATEKHPAQVQVYHEDQVIGDYVTVKFSGELRKTDAQQFLDRVEKLAEAVKFARERANTTEIIDQRGKLAPVISFLFGS